ncbi:MAG TPA: hypothetical protein VFL58_13425 [Gaiellaceae bacterium]|nr:hypothetical protein [Gaiellaceae bacterium]
MKRLNIGGAVLIAAAALIIGAVFGQPGNGRAAGNGPVGTAAPTISGTAQEGQTLSTTNGTWSNSPTSYAYAWSLCDASGGSCAPIATATAATYTAVTADVGHTLRVTVTAKNTDGSGTATSAASAVVSDKTAPTPTTAPSISGTPAVGSTLTASQGTWSGSPTSVAFAWLRCDATGDSCATISGATAATHVLTPADAGATLRVSVTATNAKGSTTFVSKQTAAAPAPTATGCPAGTGTIDAKDLAMPARLAISKASISPRLVTLSTHTIQLQVLVTACNGRPVEGAMVFAIPIPYNQFGGTERLTGADGTITLTQSRERGFPARRHDQHLLAEFIRARKPGDPILAGVSTRRTMAFQVHLP